MIHQKTDQVQAKKKRTRGFGKNNVRTFSGMI